MKLYCSNGCTPTPPYKTEGFQRQPHETHCAQPGCDGRLLTGMERNARKKAASRGGRLRDQSPAESAAAEAFHQVVCDWPCWALTHRPGHVCRGRKEAHHLLPASWIRKTFADLPEHLLLKILYAPIIGASICSGFHAGVTSKRETIYFEELERELVEFVERLDQEYPGRGVLGRLYVECPVRKAAA